LAAPPHRPGAELPAQRSRHRRGVVTPCQAD
jgi:hypothetical protein